MIQLQNVNKPDIIGASVSGLCALHCMLTPFIFLVKATTAAHIHKPVWWGLIDYIFIVVSFFAIYHAVKSSSKNWIKYALWSVWALLSCAIINETFEIAHLPEASVYTPALILVALHLYNQKYCKCAGDSCCMEKDENEYTN